MFHPSNHENIFSLPPAFDPLSSEELLQVFPFVWQPSLKVNMWDAILSRSRALDETTQQALDDRLRAVARHCIMPPDVSERIDTLLNWQSPETLKVLRASVGDDELEDVQAQFEEEILHAPDDLAAQRARIHASGITMSGWYPTELFARSFQTAPEVLLRHMERYRRVGAYVLARAGPFLTQIATEGHTAEQLRVGETWKISAVGEDMVYFALSILQSHPDFADPTKA